MIDKYTNEDAIMRAEELINAILNMVKGSDGNMPADTTTKRLKPIALKNQKGAEQSDHDSAKKECDGQQVMTFPLQQDLELKKKAVDVPSDFDDQGAGELERIKKIAGLN